MAPKSPSLSLIQRLCISSILLPRFAALCCGGIYGSNIYQPFLLILIFCLGFTLPVARLWGNFISGQRSNPYLGARKCFRAFPRGEEVGFRAWFYPFLEKPPISLFSGFSWLLGSPKKFLGFEKVARKC